MKVCIECQKQVEGSDALKVREDNMIRFIRSVKRFLKVSKENELYVCAADIQKHNERRKSFQKSIILFGVAAIFVIALAVLAMLISGSFSLGGLLSAFIIGIFLLLFAVVFKYVPDVERPRGQVQPPMPQQIQAPAAPVRQAQESMQQGNDKIQKVQKQTVKTGKTRR